MSQTPSGFTYPKPQQGSGFQQQYEGASYGQQQPYTVGAGHQPVMVGVQPTVYVTQRPLGNPANDYLGYSIFTMLCCCLPLGIAALIYSISTRDANSAGDQAKAESSSRTARILNHVALGIGLTVIIIAIILIIIGATTAGAV
ncbi:synapse differentiation-inducing gene protein 1-like [Thalassophryne amazonica]|uniref:synapse differentiation-inducing gene protein 1-like n=1 Tax=Thalassophryne amazonica TaxID=390379 RepID=UPI0014712DA0|nr:synapse differentiation-inducing gene protein 1-like [Thalassophryne amazonica]